MIPYLANKIFFAVFFKYLVVTIFICKNDKFSTLNLHRKTWRIFSSAIYKNQSVILYWYYIHILIIIGISSCRLYLLPSCSKYTYLVTFEG